MGKEEKMSTVQGKVEFDKIEVGVIPNTRTELGDVKALAADISRNGLLQPLVLLHQKQVVDKKSVTHYILVSGNRRYAAIKLLREQDKKAFVEVPATLLSGNEDDARFAQIAENIQRKDLNYVEQANAFYEMTNREYSVKDIAERVGVSQTWVNQLLKMRTKCSALVQRALAKGEISLSAAMMLADKDEDKQSKLLNKYKEVQKEKGTQAAKKATAKATDTKIIPGKRELKKLFKVIEDSTGFKSPYWKGVSDALGYTLGLDATLLDEVKSEAQNLGVTLEDAGADQGEPVEDSEPPVDE